MWDKTREGKTEDGSREEAIPNDPATPSITNHKPANQSDVHLFFSFACHLSKVFSLSPNDNCKTQRVK
jgi:hypothetical protein